MGRFESALIRARLIQVPVLLLADAVEVAAEAPVDAALVEDRQLARLTFARRQTTIRQG